MTIIPYGMNCKYWNQHQFVLFAMTGSVMYSNTQHSSDLSSGVARADNLSLQWADFNCKRTFIKPGNSIFAWSWRVTTVLLTMTNLDCYRSYFSQISCENVNFLWQGKKNRLVNHCIILPFTSSKVVSLHHKTKN